MRETMRVMAAERSVQASRVQQLGMALGGTLLGLGLGSLLLQFPSLARAAGISKSAANPRVHEHTNMKRHTQRRYACAQMMTREFLQGRRTEE